MVTEYYPERHLDAYRSTNYCRHVFDKGGPTGANVELLSAPPMEQLLTLATAAFLCTFGLPVLAVFIAHVLFVRRNSAEASGKRLHPGSYWG